MNFIKQFKQISKTDAAIAGGKGASLGEMTPVGKIHAKEKAEQDNMSQSMAFGSPRKRTQEIT